MNYHYEIVFPTYPSKEIPFENIVCVITIIPMKVYDTKGISLTSYHKNVNFVFWKYEFCLCLYHCFIAWNKDINIDVSLTVRFIFFKKNLYQKTKSYMLIYIWISWDQISKASSEFINRHFILRYNFIVWSKRQWEQNL